MPATGTGPPAPTTLPAQRTQLPAGTSLPVPNSLSISVKDNSSRGPAPTPWAAPRPHPYTPSLLVPTALHLTCRPRWGSCAARTISLQEPQGWISGALPQADQLPLLTSGWPKPCFKGPQRVNPTPGLPMGTKWSEAEPCVLPCLSPCSGQPSHGPRTPRTPTEGPGDAGCQGKSVCQSRGPRPSQESSLGPGMGVSKALDSEIRLASPRSQSLESGPALTPPPCCTKAEASPVWTGRGNHLGALSSVSWQASGFQRPGLPVLPAVAPPGGHEGVLRVVFSVPGPDEALVTKCRRAGGASALGPLNLMTGVRVWRWSACLPHHLSPPLHATE